MELVHLDEPLRHNAIFTIERPDGGWRRVFTQEYIEELRPVAETLAMIEHRPPREYVSYLQEADAIYRTRQGATIREWERFQLENDPDISEMWSKINLLLLLKKEDL